MVDLRLFAILLAAGSMGATAMAETSVINGNQPVIQGSGRIVRQGRPIGAFNAIELTGATDVEVRLGSAPSLTLEADDNLLPLLTSEVRRGTLVLGSRGSFRTNHSLRAYVTVPDLRDVHSMGSGDVTLLGVANSALNLTIQGSGDMRAMGRTGHLQAVLQGSGDFNLRDLYVRDASVGVMGSGDATVRVSGSLDASAQGSGDIRYIGHPSALSVHTGGTGDVASIGG